jgi:hypothetical protein
MLQGESNAPSAIRKRPRIVKTVACMALLALSPRISREIAVGESVEWMVYDADRIVTGKVTEARRTEDNGDTWDEATLQVTGTLKGESKGTVAFLVRSMGAVESPVGWKRDGCELLLFLVEGKRYEKDLPRYGRHALALRKENGQTGAFRLDGKPSVPLFDAQFAAHLEMKRILDATRGGIKAMQAAKPGTLRVPVPWDSPAHKALYGGSTVYLEVPLDKAMEERARKGVTSADPDVKAGGLRVIGRFKGAENIILVKALLSDPDCWIITDVVGKNRRKVYGLRREAVRILEEWGVEFQKPVLEEPIRN